MVCQLNSYSASTEVVRFNKRFLVTREPSRSCGSLAVGILVAQSESRDLMCPDTLA